MFMTLLIDRVTAHWHGVYVEVREQLVLKQLFFETAFVMGTRVLPASPRCPPVSISPVLGLQPHAISSNLIERAGNQTQVFMIGPFKTNLRGGTCL